MDYGQTEKALVELYEQYADIHYYLIEMGMDPAPLQEAYESTRLETLRRLVKWYKDRANKMISSLFTKGR